LSLAGEVDVAESRGRQYRKTWRWQQLSRTMRTLLAPVCGICGRHIDLTLPHNHPRAWTLDHIIELEDNGDPFDASNLRPACRACNSSKGNKNQRRRRQEQFRQQARRRELNPSRAW
jgi:5-methylcytosine-specific restriction endonuclease McrA